MNDFTASVEVLHLTKSGASAIVFDWKDENNFLCVTMDYGAGVVKLWGKRDGTVSDYKVVKHSLSAWENTGLSVTAAGSNITAAVNGEELFTAVVENRSSGVLGLNVFNGSAYLNRVIY